MNDACYCGERESILQFQSGVYDVVRCQVCGQVRVSGAKKGTYANQDLTVYIQEEAMFRELFQDVISFITRYKSNGTLLDIGAGVGLLVDEANKAGFDAYGIEASKEAVGIAKKEFRVTLTRGTFTHGLYKRAFDVIIINHVLEHLDDPKQILMDMVEDLNPGGVIVIGVPNYGSLVRKLKNKRWQSLIPEEHRWQFTRTTLNRLARSVGLYPIGYRHESHSRSMHTGWRRGVYALVDLIAKLTRSEEAMLVAYRKL